MKCKLVTTIQAGVHNPEPLGEWLPVGHIIDLPKVFRLVQMGVAVPADEACRILASMSDEKMADVQRRYPAIAKGICPEDREDFLAGKMDGYNADMSPKPGPNFEQDEDEEEEDEDE